MTWPPRATSCAPGSPSRRKASAGGGPRPGPTTPRSYARLYPRQDYPCRGFLLDPVSDESKKGWRRCTPISPAPSIPVAVYPSAATVDIGEEAERWLITLLWSYS